jgi:hypothetical protein
VGLDVALTYFIDQENWSIKHLQIRDILKESQFEDCKMVSMPVDGYERLQAATAQGAPLTDVATYQRALGQLN